MNAVYGRDLDLNLLRVFVTVAEAGSVTAAADRLYLTQPAVSAALARLSSSLGYSPFMRAGRGLVLTARGQRLLGAARPHLEALVEAALSPGAFDPKSSERTVRLGIADSSETWLLPELLQALGREAPRMRVVVVPVQFRTIADALSSARVDIAVTVADDLGPNVERKTLYRSGFVCLFDPKHARFGARITKAQYLASRHVVVSYNGDMRGIVEDALGIQRDVRVSVPSFSALGAIVHGSPLVATVPRTVARAIVSVWRTLRTAPVPLPVPGAPVDLLWRAADADDPALRFLRDLTERVTARTVRG